MVTESTVVRVKWSVFALAAATIIAGVILQCYGLARVFQVDPAVASREGLATNDALGPYLDCDQVSRLRPGANATGQTGVLDRAYANQCKSKQAPFMYLWAATASLAFLILPIIAWALHKETRGPILLSAIWIPVVLSMAFICLYAYLHAVPNSDRLLYCDHMAPEEAAEVQKQNLGRCIENSDSAQDWHRARRCLLSGIILNLLAMAFLSWLLPWIFHLSKVRVVLPSSVKEEFRTHRPPAESMQAMPIGSTAYPQPPHATGPSYV